MIRSELSLPFVVVGLLIAGMITLSTAAPSNEFSRQLVFLGVSVVAAPPLP